MGDGPVFCQRIFVGGSIKVGPTIYIVISRVINPFIALY